MTCGLTFVERWPIGSASWGERRAERWPTQKFNFVGTARPARGPLPERDQGRGLVTLALVLGAGGTHAAFEVGAVRWLTDHGYKFSIICGTSGGALNASRLAEGEIAGSDPAIARLERDWLALRNDADMWQPKPWLSRLGMDQQKLLRDSSLWDNIPWVFLGVKLLAGFVGAVDCKDFVNTL